MTKPAPVIPVPIVSHGVIPQPVHNASSTMPSVQTVAAPVWSQRHLLEAYAKADWKDLTEQFVKVFQYFESVVCIEDGMVVEHITPFIKTFLFLITQPEYIVPEAHVRTFVRLNTLISNLVAMTPFKNTDAALEMLFRQENNFIKILCLFSPRTTLKVDRKALFDTDPFLASLWYYHYCCVYKSGLVNQTIIDNFKEHLLFKDDRLTPQTAMADPYFLSSYLVEEGLDKKIKPVINKAIQRYQQYPIKPHKPHTGRKSIAVFSDLWFVTHSVYRNYNFYVRELQKHYDVTLLHNIAKADQLDTEGFKDVRYLDLPNAKPMESVVDGFDMFYFPDIGMTEPSMMLANCRMAPIQITSPGHSVSTYGAEIDYFMSGADVESSSAWKNYSERLVLMPGMGAIHNEPRYVPRGVKKSCKEVLIACPWSGHKTHLEFLKVIRKIIDRSGVKLRLRMFSGTGISQNNGHYPFVKDVQRILGNGAEVEIYSGMLYDDYMRMMEECDITLDCFHFAGCNSVADSLWLKKPTLVWEGNVWYNRIGPAMLRTIGHGAMIATSEEEYIEKALELISGRAYPSFGGIDLMDTVFSRKDAGQFAKAVDYLFKNHAKIQKRVSREAVRI